MLYFDYKTRKTIHKIRKFNKAKAGNKEKKSLLKCKQVEAMQWNSDVGSLGGSQVLRVESSWMELVSV